MFDFACVGYQLDDTYTVSDFKQRCNHWVLSGHVHNPGSSGNVLYAGSFDRLSHNEEHRKGYYILDGSPKFIENKLAIMYKTLTFKTSDVETMFLEYSDFVTAHFSGVAYGYLRVLLDDPQLRLAVKSFHQKSNSHILLTFKRSTDKSSGKKHLVKSNITTKLEAPTRSNLPKLVHSHLKLKKINIELDAVNEVLKPGGEVLGNAI